MKLSIKESIQIGTAVDLYYYLNLKKYSTDILEKMSFNRRFFLHQ
jgi:hypothetical protein